jgi:hypothetical protein
MLRTGAAYAGGVTAVADGTAAVCGRGASAQTISVVQTAEEPNPESRPQRPARPGLSLRSHEASETIPGRRSLQGDELRALAFAGTSFAVSSRHSAGQG